MQTTGGEKEIESVTTLEATEAETIGNEVEKIQEKKNLIKKPAGCSREQTIRQTDRKGKRSRTKGPLLDRQENRGKERQKTRSEFAQVLNEDGSLQRVKLEKIERKDNFTMRKEEEEGPVKEVSTGEGPDRCRNHPCALG